MKISELFTRKESSAFTTEPTNLIDLPSKNSCNCGKIFGIAPTVEDGKPFHKAVFGKILETMASGGDTSSIEQMERTSPAAQNEWQSHFISHMNAAGVTPKDLGIEDDELGKNYLAGRGLANNTIQNLVNEPYDFDSDNCGTCNQYFGELKNHVRKYAEGATKSIASLPESQREMGKISVNNVLKNIWDSWKNKSRATGIKDEAIDVGNKIIDNWNKHSVDSHGVSLHPDPIKHTPVVEDKGDKLNVLYRNLRNLSPGWNFVKRDPKDTAVTKNFDEIKVNWPHNDLKEDSLLKQKPKMEDGREMTQEDALTRYRRINPDGITTVKGPGGINRIQYEGPQFIGHENGKYYRKDMPATLEYNPADDPRAELFDEPVHTGDRPEIYQEYKNHTGTQCFNGECKNPEKCNGNHEVTYVSGGDATTGYKTKTKTVNYKRTGCTKCGDPSCDGWHEIDRSDLKMLPRQHAFLFQKAGVTPDLAAHKEILNKLHEHEMSKGLVPTGRTITRTVEEPDVDMVPHAIINNRAFLFDDTIPLVLRPRLLPVQKLDAAGNGLNITRTIEEAELRPAEPDPAPTLEEHAKARADYQASFDNALDTAYPGVSREEALGLLDAEHRQRVNNLEVIRNKSLQSVNRRFHASKEEEQRPVFNAGIL